jgi:hypothetical protein
MKKKTKKMHPLVQGILGILLFSLAAASIFFFFLQIDFRKIPFWGKTIERFSKTSTRIIDEKESLFLQSASFNIDFLLKLETKDGVYLAIYPYEVLMGIDGNKILFEKNQDTQDCYLPVPEILQSEVADTDSILEIVNTIHSSDFSYNTIISPIKKAFEQKAIDEALENNYFTDSFISRTKKNIEDLYPEKIFFVNEKEIREALENTMQRIDAHFLPAEFKVQKDFFDHFDSNLFQENNQKNKIENEIENEKYFTRDDSQIDALRFGLVKNFAKLPSLSYATFKNKNLLKQDKVKLIASWLNPLDNNTSKTFLFAGEDGYEKAITLFQDGSISYIEPRGMNIDERNAFYSFPLAYLAMSIEYKIFGQDEKKTLNEYEQFSSLYDQALEYLEEEKYTRLDLQLRQLKEWKHKEEDAIQLLQALFDAAVFYQYNPVPMEAYENFNALLFLQAHLHQLRHFNSPENRSKALEEMETISRNNQDTLTIQSLKALFLKNKTLLELSPSEIQGYENDIIESGIIISKELFSSLDEKGRKSYILNTFKDLTKNDAQRMQIEEVNHRTFLFLDEAYDELYTKKSKKIFDIAKRIETKLENKTSLVILFPQKKSFTTQFHCLIFHSDSLSFIENITSPFSFQEAKAFPYEKISLSSKAFLLGSKAFENDILLALLETIHNAYYFDQIYHIELDKNIRTQLLKEVRDVMDRPQY